MAEYVCWGEHAEDLTDLVRQKYREGGPDFGLLPRGRHKWAVVVVCSEKHKNVFEGEREP